MRLVYNKTDGTIVTVLPNDMDYKKMFCKFSNDFINELDEISVGTFSPRDIEKYKVENGNIRAYNNTELEEIGQYGRTLSNYERLLIDLKPSNKEVEKAEESLRLLELIREVM